VTVGYGHAAPSMQLGQTITQEQADDFLDEDLEAIETFLNSAITRSNLTQGQFDALCDFVYNTGPRVLLKSRLLGLINSGADWNAANDLLNFDHDETGAVLPGLLNRRNAERELYLGV
jgi:lysozyme